MRLSGVSEQMDMDGDDLDLAMGRVMGKASLTKHKSDLTRMIATMEKKRLALHDYLDYEEMVELNGAIQSFYKLRNRISGARVKLIKAEKSDSKINKVNYSFES